MERTPGPEESARVRLTLIGAAMMAPVLGPGVTGVRGRVVSMDSSVVRMSVVAVTDRDGLENTWLGEQVTIKREHIEGYDERQLSTPKSILVGAGIGFGMYLMARVAAGGSDGLLAAIGLPQKR